MSLYTAFLLRFLRFLIKKLVLTFFTLVIPILLREQLCYRGISSRNSVRPSVRAAL